MEPKKLKRLVKMPLSSLKEKANKVRVANGINEVDICTILNAKSGKCSEDCEFCSQSIHYNTQIDEYPLKSHIKIYNSAQKAKKIGAKRFGIVTSGRKISQKDIDSLCKTIKEIRDKLNMSVCLSLGALSKNELQKLRLSGATRYHHNLETSANYYSRIVSTHSYSQRVQTVKEAKQLGFEVCSGGIFGLGESWQDRLDLALLLKKLNVDSVPINFLVPIPGTPLEGKKLLSADEALRIICIYRIILKSQTIKVAAGRELILEKAQKDMYMSGCNGMLIGGYLTVKGWPEEKDKKLIKNVRALWEQDSTNS